MHSRQIEVDKMLGDKVQTVTGRNRGRLAADGPGPRRDKLIDYVNKLVRLTRAGRSFIWELRRERGWP